MNCFRRKQNLGNFHLLLLQIFAFDLVCRAALFFFTFLSGVILGKAVLLEVRFRQHIFADLGKCFLWMAQDQIIAHQFFQKQHRSGAVCQGMEYFEIDSGFIVRNLEKKRFVVGYVNLTARRTLFLFYFCWQIALLQIKPEKTFPQYHGKHRVMLHCLLQRFLQQIRLDVLFQLAVKPEDSRILFSGGRRKCLCRVVQLSPARRMFFLHFLCLLTPSRVSIVSSLLLCFPVLRLHFSAVFLSLKMHSYTENFPAHIGVQCQAQNSRAMHP